MSNHNIPRYFIYAATTIVTLAPLLLGGCAAEPNSDYTQYPANGTPVKVYSETTAVTAPATSYYDASTKTTVHIGPTTTTTETVGPADVTYEDDEGFWHTTYDTGE